MNKIVLGLLVGALLGAIDGGTAWFTPAVRPAIVGIIIGSTIYESSPDIAAGAARWGIGIAQRWHAAASAETA